MAYNLAQQNEIGLFWQVMAQMPGLRMTPDIKKIFNNAIASVHQSGTSAFGFTSGSNGAGGSGWNEGYIIALIRGTKSYNQTYAGIKNNPGMSESQYMSQIASYKEQAAAAHVTFTHQEYQNLIKNQVSVSEASDRFTAVSTVRNNPDMFLSFNEELKAEGLKPFTTSSGGLDEKGATNFLLGKSNPVYYATWQKAATRYQMTQAGVEVNPAGRQTGSNSEDFTSISYQQLKDIVTKQGSSRSAAQVNPSDLYKALGNVLPESQLEGFGLTKDDIIAGTYGGPKQGKINDMIMQLGANVQTAQNQVTSDPAAAFSRGRQQRAQS